MMHITLPTDLIVRPANRDDAQAIAEINAEHELALTGTTESTVSDVFELWDAERMVLADDTRVILAPSGELVGYTGVVATTRGFMLDVHTEVRLSYQEQPIMGYLLRFAEERAHALCVANPAVPRQLYTWSFTPATRQLLEQYGYTVESSDVRMEITFDEAPATPQPLQGIIIRPFTAGKEERAIHSVIAEAFPDIDGKPYYPFEEWYENIFEKSTSFEPSLLYVALANGEIVGTIVCRIYPEENEGYAWQVAVRRGWRKHGIARQLLLTTFNEYYQRGIRRVQLSVDAENPTGAHQLYANVGMTRHSRVDDMVKTF